MVVLGRITGAFGIRGWVRVHPFGDDPESWGKMASWWLSRDADGGDWEGRELLEAKWHGDGLVAHLKGIEDRTAAEALRGCYVGAPREALPESEEGEYYWADLVGLAVVNLAGESLGNVVEVIQGVAHDVLRLKDDAGVERMLPFVDAVVKEVDTEAGRVRVEWGVDWGLD
ncbi:MAG: ribosome maturation factor RimM [Rhodocyclaceae bacterium]|nr:ribosome maturation factor RimM [Rhodocyclaceae bacterium]